jgi:hypothetical protein
MEAKKIAGESGGLDSGLSCMTLQKSLKLSETSFFIFKIKRIFLKFLHIKNA